MNHQSVFVGWLGILFVFMAVPNVLAHDLWLLPPGKLEPNKPEFVRVNSGSTFPKGDHAPDPSKFKRLLLVQPDGKQGTVAAAGTKETSGLLKVEPTTSGLYIVAVETQPKLITLEADKFNEYLVSDGLVPIYQLRRKEGLLTTPGRERYSKSPKAIMQVGKERGGDPCRVVGLPLEIVPLKDPLALKIGDTLRVRVLFRDKPLANANLGWDAPGGDDIPLGTIRTDSRGEALVPISQLGLMTIRLTHMTRPKMADYEWESFWTTLTFRILE
jgi:hypothetical protein